MIGELVEGQVKEWYRRLPEADKNNWERLSTLFRNKYGVQENDEMLWRELDKKIGENEDMEEHVDRFRENWGRWLGRGQPVEQPNLVFLKKKKFLESLTGYVRYKADLRNPETFEELVEIAIY